MAEWILPFEDKDITCAHGVVDKLHPNGHRGTDYGKGKARLGAPIKAIVDAKVVVSDFHHNLGNVVVLKLPTGKYAYFCHLQAPGLAKDTVVKSGEVIGKVGNTGAYSFGAHLHCGVSDGPTGYIAGKVESLPAYVKAMQKKAKANEAKAEDIAAAKAAKEAEVAVVAEAPAEAAPIAEPVAEKPVKAKKK